MEMKTNGYIDLREVPNEIIIGIFSHIGGDYYAGVDQLLGGTKLLLEEFKLIANPYCPAIIEEKKRAIVDETAKGIYELAEKNPVVSDEYIKQHADVIKTAKYKIAELEKKQQIHDSFYQQIEEILKRESWLQEKKPLLVRGHLKTIIINDGNAVYVEHQNVHNNLNVLYQEANHKEIVDNLINEVYTSCESSETIEVQTTTPQENE